MSDKPTKERILDAAEELMLENSFHSVGLTQILTAVNVPKGSFYHHFKSKEDFGIELLKHYSAKSDICKRQILLNSEFSNNPIERLIGFFENYVTNFEKNEGSCPCLIVKLNAEVITLNNEMRQIISDGFADSIKLFEDLLNEATDQGLLSPSLDTSTQACFIHDLWYGALIRAITCQSVKPLNTALSIIKNSIQTGSSL